jgi:hypothetical protein
MHTALTTDPRGHQVIVNWRTEQLMMRPEIEALAGIYKFDNPEKIDTFLYKAGKPVIEILKDAPNQIARVFGNVHLHLNAINDPEEDFEALFIKIKTALPAGRALDLLDELDNAWWLDVDKDIRKILAVDVS